MDMRLDFAATLQVVGPSGSGKTMFVCNLLQTPLIFRYKINNIIWLMGAEEGEVGETKEILKKLKSVRFLHGFEPNWLDTVERGDVLVVDDLYQEANKENNFNNLFTKVAHHRQVFVIFITQNLFHQGGHHRTRNLNVQYMVLFRNPRDQTVIDYLARQMFPQNRKFLLDAFDDATKNKPHSYLFLDFTQECPDDYRIRANMLDVYGIIVYKPGNQRSFFRNRESYPIVENMSPWSSERSLTNSTRSSSRRSAASSSRRSGASSSRRSAASARRRSIEPSPSSSSVQRQRRRPLQSQRQLHASPSEELL